MSCLVLKADTTKLTEALSFLSEALEAGSEVAHRLVDLLEPIEEFVSIEADLTPAPLAGEVVVRLNPSDRLLGLVAAVRAGNS